VSIDEFEQLAWFAAALITANCRQRLQIKPAHDRAQSSLFAASDLVIRKRFYQKAHPRFAPESR
jgi:hypothetical protein